MANRIKISEQDWKKLPIRTLVIEAGNSIEYETGSWRVFRPVINFKKCTHCMFCWLFCPDSSVIVKDSKLVGVDLKHCKGCGICASECPRQAITMEEESKFWQ